MKTKLFYLFFLLPLFSIGQVRGDLNDQNPNHKVAAANYEELAKEAHLQQSVTLQNTYEAIDELQSKRDWKKYKKEARFEAKMYRKKYGIRYSNPYTYRYNPRRNYDYHRLHYGNYPFLFQIP